MLYEQPSVWLCVGGAESRAEVLHLMVQRVLQLQEAMAFSQQQVSQSLASSQATAACSRTQEGMSAASGEKPSPVQGLSANQQQNAGQPVPPYHAGLSSGLRAQTALSGLSIPEQPQAVHIGRPPALSTPAWQAQDISTGLGASSQAACATGSARTGVDSESDEDPEEVLQEAYMAEVLNMPFLTQVSELPSRLGSDQALTSPMNTCNNLIVINCSCPTALTIDPASPQCLMLWLRADHSKS